MRQNRNNIFIFVYGKKEYTSKTADHGFFKEQKNSDQPGDITERTGRNGRPGNDLQGFKQLL